MAKVVSEIKQTNKRLGEDVLQLKMQYKNSKKERKEVESKLESVQQESVMLMNDVQLLTEQLRAKNSVLEELEKQLDKGLKSLRSNEHDMQSIKMLYKPMTPNQIAA